jgi:hypothetical protein
MWETAASLPPADFRRTAMNHYKKISLLLVALCVHVPQLRASDPRSAAPPLPQNTILAATWVRNYQCFSLTNNEIASLNVLLRGERIHSPEEFIPPRKAFDILLWGVKEDKLVTVEVVSVFRGTRLMFSRNRGVYIPIDDSKERKTLLDMMDRIEKELPLIDQSDNGRHR